ncbi:hypothetical protein EAE96_009890 [Botrytis aclada]|nr:hypothetical protein EAE96_009890 [Botrytis aclada]
MFSRLTSRLSRVPSTDEKESTNDQKANNIEKEIQSYGNNETKKNTHQSAKQYDRYVNSPERTRRLLNLLRYDPGNDNLPPYSSTQPSRPSPGLPDQQKPSVKGKEMKNDTPPPYDLSEYMSSASRQQSTRGFIEEKKARLRTLKQLKETRRAGSSSTDTTMRVEESSSMHITLRREAALEELKEGTLRTGISPEDMEYYIQLFNKKWDVMTENMELLQGLKNKTVLKEEKEREDSTLQHDLGVERDTLICCCCQRMQELQTRRKQAKPPYYYHPTGFV